MKKYLGAELFFESLYKLGIRIIFGLPGGYVLKIYDVMPSYAKKITHILTRHEQAATHMADGFARASNLPGVILCTSGPAATNTVTGITTAHIDSVPVLIFTGQVPVPFLGSDAFQEADHIGITRSCTKHNTLVRKTVDLPKAIAEALHISSTGRKGPVLVDMPKDVLIGESEFKIPNKVKLKNYSENPELQKKDFNKFKSALKNSNKPLLIYGRGSCAESNTKYIEKISQIFKIPSLSSILSLGVLGKSKNNFGLVGEEGSYASNILINESDLIISIGCDLKKIIPESSLDGKKMVVVNIDNTQFLNDNKNILNILTNSSFFLEAFSRLKDKMKFSWDKEDLSLLHKKNSENKLKIISKNKKAFIFSTLSELLGDKAIICSDFSYEDVNLQQFYNFTDYRNSIMSGGVGTPGYGFPAAIGAKFSRPRSKVVSISSGENFQFNMQELIVAREQKLDLTIIVLNEDSQLNGKGHENPDYKMMGQSFGVKSVTINLGKNIKNQLKKHLSHKGLRLIEILI
ncbi:MAG: thiamine pyrophosphate-binding protein [Thermodesulfobacteriota bacterium]|nr:thiamine pyrophosphate-binding protein [Thermodesulfobacteriota bacterium]